MIRPVVPLWGLSLLVAVTLSSSLSGPLFWCKLGIHGVLLLSLELYRGLTGLTLKANLLMASVAKTEGETGGGYLLNFHGMSLMILSEQKTFTD